MIGNIILVLFIITAVLGAIVFCGVVISNTFGQQSHINKMVASINKMARNKYCEHANKYIIDTLKDLDIRIRFDYDDFLNRVTSIEINHDEYGTLYYYRRRGDFTQVHDEYIKIYKDINDIFDEASRITTKEDAIKAAERLEQMANYHRDTYQITKKMNS